MKTCADFGFLALKYSMTPGLEEESASYRKTGNASAIHDQLPVCFVGADDLATEVKLVPGSLSRVEVLKVIQKDCSECPDWFP